MSITPINFSTTKIANTTTAGTVITPKEQKEIRHKNNPFRNTDLVPVSVCCGIGLMAVYAIRSGKIKSIKKLNHLA